MKIAQIERFMLVGCLIALLGRCGGSLETTEAQGQEESSKFDLWLAPSSFYGAAIHPYAPYGQQEDRIYVTQEDFEALRAAGANVVALNYPGPFAPEPPYDIDAEALQFLDDAIDWAEAAGLAAIIHFRNGPGKPEESFFSEAAPSGREDETLWYSEEAQKQWVEMWRLVATRYLDRSHIVGYNLMVEPHPEDPIDQDPLGPEVWMDLATRITQAIREVDSEIPLIVGASWWSNPIGFESMGTTGDEKTIYSFHMYEPFLFTHQGLDWIGLGDSESYEYPGMIPSDLFAETRYWDADLIAEFFALVSDFETANQVPIFVGEFGCNRQVPTCVDFLADLLTIFADHGWSYTFYVWRVDNDFDYEKGVAGDVHRQDSEYLTLFQEHWNN